MKAKLFIAAAILLTAIGSSACEKKQQAATEKPSLAQSVRVEKISLTPVDEVYEATGTVKAQTTTALSAKLMGNVVALNVREGDRVRAGQTLIELDNRDAATQLQKAQAGWREAQQTLAEVEQASAAAQSAQAAAEANRQFAASTFARYQTLLERQAISPHEFDEVKAKYQIAEAETRRAEQMAQTLIARKNQALARIDQAKADISNAQITVGYGRITSPINGIVTAKQIEVGAIAAPGVPLLMIEDNSQYRLEATVEESQLGRIHLHDTVGVQIAALGAETVSGKVVEIVPITDTASRSYIVKIGLPALPTLRSGLYGKARFLTGHRQALTISPKAIVQQGQLTSLYVVDDGGVARLRLVKTGKAYGEQIEILSGLNDGERVIVEGQVQVSDGSRVR
ncbi:MAG: efflux RND transporter periplasmic adaptor subunit [Acidobacteria bacterium]|nr:efflux RND transporter periplasmic adaptor subunit [Acidobacteriota bacterium]